VTPKQTNLFLISLFQNLISLINDTFLEAHVRIVECVTSKVYTISPCWRPTAADNQKTILARHCKHNASIVVLFYRFSSSCVIGVKDASIFDDKLQYQSSVSSTTIIKNYLLMLGPVWSIFENSLLFRY